HKVGEIRSILGESFHYLTLKDFPDAPEVIEDADTFAGNATKKAVQLAHWLASSKSNISNSKFFILADDSGLEVDALGGQPGVHSARFAALDKNENSSDTDNRAKLLRVMEHIPDVKRAARFRCVLALVKIRAQSIISGPQLFDGACEGKIISVLRGQNGFGYDPLFVPDGFDKTFGELGEAIKNQLSHRAKALVKMRSALAHQPISE
ncbi:MAG TPA: non-canonical purine NTP pyrophosphatase, partial [Verrucomicrobiae bacterium]|nr:non-canonical purine NTP pyrophosphatase [Verrucomicrobiae bacterium]